MILFMYLYIALRFKQTLKYKSWQESDSRKNYDVEEITKS